MTQRCRLLCRLVCPDCSFQPQLLPLTALLPLTTTFFFALRKSRSKVKCAIVIELPRPFTRARQGVYSIMQKFCALVDNNNMHLENGTIQFLHIYVCIYRFYYWPYGVLEQSGIKGPKPSFFYGNFKDLAKVVSTTL